MVKTFRRALMALTAAVAAGAALRLRTSERPRPQGGGWRELSGPDLR